MKRHIAMALTCLGLSACRPSSEAGPTPPPSSEIDGSPGGPVDGGADTTPALTGDDCYFGWDGGACPPGCGERWASVQGDSGTCFVGVRLYCRHSLTVAARRNSLATSARPTVASSCSATWPRWTSGKGAGLPALRRRPAPKLPPPGASPPLPALAMPSPAWDSPRAVPPRRPAQRRRRRRKSTAVRAGPSMAERTPRRPSRATILDGGAAPPPPFRLPHGAHAVPATSARPTAASSCSATWPRWTLAREPDCPHCDDAHQASMKLRLAGPRARSRPPTTVRHATAPPAVNPISRRCRRRRATRLARFR